jgi:hypothetical protein
MLEAGGWKLTAHRAFLKLSSLYFRRFLPSDPKSVLINRQPHDKLSIRQEKIDRLAKFSK